MALIPGKPVTPTSLDTATLTSASIGLLTLNPTASAAAQHLILNQGYSFYADNNGAGTANSRLWADAPDGGEMVLGPRSGTAFLTSFRIRTNATTATAANCFIDGTTQKISRSTSSRRYKTGITDVNLDLDAFRQLRVVTFQDRKEHEQLGDDAPWYIGLVAEEVHDLGLHQLVAYMQTDGGPIPDGVQYDRLTLGLLQLATRQADELAELRARLERLEQTVANLAQGES